MEEETRHNPLIEVGVGQETDLQHALERSL
jgi:hypothetical protein